MNRLIKRIILKLFPLSLRVSLAPFWVAYKSLSRDFVKLRIRFCKLDYSEDLEYTIILSACEILGRNGFIVPSYIVDVGVNDGFRGSNSYNFIRDSWNALLIDPNPNCVRAVSKLHRLNPNVIIEPICISSKDGFSEFYISTSHPFDGGGSLNFDFSKSRNLLLSSFEVRTSTLSNCLEGYQLQANDIGVLSIDTEGHDVEVLKSIGIYRPIFIIVERGRAELDSLGPKRRLMASLEYSLYFRTYSNDIYVLNPCYDLLTASDTLSIA